MILNTLTILHVVLSLIGIGSGVVATHRLLKAKTPGRWTQIFLATTATTSVTGFLFPLQGVTPAQVLGVLSLIALINREPFDLSVPLSRDLAPDLSDHSRDGALFQRFRAGRSALSSGSGAARRGSDPVGTAFPDSSDRRVAVVHGDWNSRGESKATSRANPVTPQSQRKLTNENQNISWAAARVVVVRSVAARDAHTPRGDAWRSG